MLQIQYFNSEEIAAAAVAESLQSCPTLCDPIDAAPGILQARTLEWVAISQKKLRMYQFVLVWRYSLDHGKSKRVPEKHLFLLY